MCGRRAKISGRRVRYPREHRHQSQPARYRMPGRRDPVGDFRRPQTRITPGSSGAGRDAVRTRNGPRAVQPVRRNRRRFRPTYGRPLFKLLARFLFYPRVWLLNRRRSAKSELSRRHPVWPCHRRPSQVHGHFDRSVSQASEIFEKALSNRITCLTRSRCFERGKSPRRRSC